MVDELRTEIPRAFDTAEYSRRRDQIAQDLETKRQKELAESEERVARAGFKLVKGPAGLLLAPAIEGRLLGEEDIGRLTPEEREKVLRVIGNLQREIEDRWRTIRQLERGARDALHALDAETATQAAHHLIDDLRARYQSQPAVVEYLDALEADVIAHTDDFRRGKEAETPRLPLHHRQGQAPRGCSPVTRSTSWSTTRI